MPRKQAEVEKSLEAKGFQRPKGGDHNYFHYYSRDGKKTAVFTKTSHGAREIDDSLLGRMAKQCKLKRADFDRLIDCTLDRGAYEAKLGETGFLDVLRP
jgi:predicted RNA binding protein YcfA (HicA-like mRNA interferase family)